jgi:hypothetical protein
MEGLYGFISQERPVQNLVIEKQIKHFVIIIVCECCGIISLECILEKPSLEKQPGHRLEESPKQSMCSDTDNSLELLALLCPSSSIPLIRVYSLTLLDISVDESIPNVSGENRYTTKINQH